jgi:hypothetical protein
VSAKVKLIIMLFALYLNDSADYRQKQLDSFEYCDIWKVKVNVSKIGDEII